MSGCLQSPDEKAAFAAVQEAFKNGVNFFDVAPFYASGDAEKVLSCYCKPVNICRRLLQMMALQQLVM